MLCFSFQIQSRPGGYDIKATSIGFVLIPDIEYRPGG